MMNVRKIETLAIWAMAVAFMAISPAGAEEHFPIHFDVGSSAEVVSHRHGDTHSIGKPQLGALVNGVTLQGGPQVSVRKNKNYGTPELISLIQRGVAMVHARMPGTPQLHVGDISFRHGGPMGRHLSHQSGRDADVSYYLKTGHTPERFKKATARTIDVKRTWIFLESLLRSGQTEVIFSEAPLIRVLKSHAKRQSGADPALIKRWFDGDKSAGQSKPVIRHLKGHANHFHLRVRAPSSQSTIEQLGHGPKANKARNTLAKAKRYRAGLKGKKSSIRGRTHAKKPRRFTARAQPQRFFRSGPVFRPSGPRPVVRNFKSGHRTTRRARERAKLARKRARSARLKRRQKKSS